MPEPDQLILTEISDLEGRYRAPDATLAARIGGLLRSIRNERAGPWLERAAADDPASWQNRWNLAHWLWTLGELERGFALCHDILERWHLETHPECQKLPLLKPGDSIRNKRVLVTNYGGIGDLFHRCRHLALLQDAGTDYALHLSDRCRGAAHLMRFNEIPLASSTDGFDVWIPDTHIPQFLGIYPAIRSEGYLKADPSLMDIWRQRLPDDFAALCWRSGPEPEGFHPKKSRSASLKRAIAEVKGDLPLVSLQNELQEGEAHPRLLHQPTDIDDLCAVLCLAAQIVTVDTLAANAAGALGCDFTILLPPWPDWRWHHGQTPNPWYQGARPSWIEDERAC
jgi:hypothetical protein